MVLCNISKNNTLNLKLIDDNFPTHQGFGFVLIVPKYLCHLSK